MQKNLPFIVSGTLAACIGPCLCTHASNLCMHGVGFRGLYFPKIDLFAHKKCGRDLAWWNRNIFGNKR